MLGKLPRHTLLLCLLFMPLTQGAEKPLDTIVVESSRARLNEIRHEITQLDDHFLERYNEINPVKDFDVHCAEEARLGTRLARRYCRAVYVDKALENEGQEAIQFRQRIDAGRPGKEPMVTGGPPAPAIMAVDARRKDYQKNMLEVTRRDPELIRLLQERAGLVERYEALQHKIFGRKPPPEEASLSGFPGSGGAASSE